MLQQPRPSEAQLNGLAEISALVVTAVQTGLPREGDGTRSFAGQTVTGEVTDLERWRRRVDDDETHFTQGLGAVGKTGGHPIPSTSLHWHLDAADRIPARMRTLAATQAA
jgi:hypothetical protein